MKKIILLIILSVLTLIMCSCDEATPTSSPPTLTPTPEPDSSTVLTTIVPTPTPTLQDTLPHPTKTATPTPTLEDTLPHPTMELYGKFYKLLSTATWASRPLEICKDFDGSEYIGLNVIIDSKEKDFSENIGSEEYEYTWLLAYHNAEIFPKNNDDLIGFYTVTPTVFEKLEDGKIVYRLPVSSSPEGDFTKNVKVGEVDMLLICILKDGMIDGYVYNSISWTEKDMGTRDTFYASKN